MSDNEEIIICGKCRNQTYELRYDEGGYETSVLKCTSCGTTLGIVSLTADAEVI